MSKLLLAGILIILAVGALQIYQGNSADERYRSLSDKDRRYYGLASDEREVQEAIDRALSPAERAAFE